MEFVTFGKAIRLKCLDCSDQQPNEVRLYPVKTCPLWPYRFGTQPKNLTPGSRGYQRWSEANEAVETGLRSAKRAQN